MLSTTTVASSQRRVTGAWGPEDLIEKAFDLREYDQGDLLEIGTLRVRFHQVPHFLPNTNAVEFSSMNGGGRLTYGADHSPTSASTACSTCAWATCATRRSTPG